MHNDHITLSILIALLLSTPLATITVPKAYAQQEMTPTQTFETPEQYNKIALSADGKHIAAISNTTDTLAVFNQTHELWSTHIPRIHSVAMSENPTLIATASTSGIYLFNTSNPTPQQHYNLSYENPMITLSSDGNTLAYAATTANQNDNPSTTLYMFQTGTLTPTWHTTLEGTLNSLSTTDNGTHTTITTNQPATLHLFTKQQQTPLWTYNFGDRSGAAKISNNGNYIITTGENQTAEYGIRIYRFRTQSSLPNYIKIISEPIPGQRLTVASQGTIFALAFAETNRLVFFNLDLPPYGYGPESIRNITLPTKPTIMAMSSDGKYTAVGTDAGIYVYEYANRELTLTKQYTNNNLHILDIALTPDGQHLAATTPDTICLFDIRETQNDPNFWLYITALAIIILAISTISVYFLRRKRKPQKPTNTN